jgi:hypothetical protein
MSQGVHLPPPAGQGTDLPDYDPPAEYGHAARAWHTFCKGFGKHAALDGFHLDGHPLAVVLLAALCEPVFYSSEFTGDLIADAIGGVRSFVEHLDGDAEGGGGVGAWVHGYQIEGLLRRLDAVLTLRKYEREYGKIGGGPNGA